MKLPQRETTDQKAVCTGFLGPYLYAFSTRFYISLGSEVLGADVECAHGQEPAVLAQGVSDIRLRFRHGEIKWLVSTNCVDNRSCQRQPLSGKSPYHHHRIQTGTDCEGQFSPLDRIGCHLIRLGP